MEHPLGTNPRPQGRTGAQGGAAQGCFPGTGGGWGGRRARGPGKVGRQAQGCGGGRTGEAEGGRRSRGRWVAAPPSAPRTAPGLPPRAGPRTAQASCVTHQLLTCRMVSPVSCASCFFCSSEGYGCCSHQRELPGLPGCPLIPKAWPAQVPQGDWLAQVGAGLGEPSCLSFYAPRSPSEGGRAKLWAITLASPPPTPPHNLFQQLEANWPTLIREVELGLGGTPPPRGREAKPSTGPC